MPNVAMISAHGAKYSDAVGGTVTLVSNYNGTGETWRVHSFTSSGTLTVRSNAQPFRALVLGGGASSGDYLVGLFNNNPSNPAALGLCMGGGGGAGEFYENDAVALPTGNIAVTVPGSSAFGANGGDTTLAGVKTSLGGGAGGAGGGGGGSRATGGGGGWDATGNKASGAGLAQVAGHGNGSSAEYGVSGAGGGAGGSASGTTGGVGRTSNIEGATYTYCTGGGRGGGRYGSGARGGAGWNAGGQGGAVIVAYKYQ